MDILFLIIAFLIALTVHEAAHAWTANYLGDATARLMGRMTLNPVPHIDIFGTVILPAILILSSVGFVFGYAKPVEINPNNFKDPKVGSALTAIAGPLTNFIIAGIALLALRFIPAGLLSEFLVILATVNITLLIFNLLPIPPLDGSKVLYTFMSYSAQVTMERLGPFLLLALLIFGQGILGSIIKEGQGLVLKIFGY